MTHLHSTRRVFNSRTAGEVIREHKKHQNSLRLEDPTEGAYIAPQAQEHALPKATTPLSTLRTSSFSPWSRSNWSRDLKLLLNQGPLERCYATADYILVSRLLNCLLILRVVCDCMNVTVDLLILNALMHSYFIRSRIATEERTVPNEVYSYLYGYAYLFILYDTCSLQLWIRPWPRSRW